MNPVQGLNGALPDFQTGLHQHNDNEYETMDVGYSKLFLDLGN